MSVYTPSYPPYTQTGADVGKDLSGGWYDAGDFIKFHVPMAYSTIVLLWGLIRYQARRRVDGFRLDGLGINRPITARPYRSPTQQEAYEVAGQLDAMRDAVRWPLDYFLKTHTAPDELYVQVGAPVRDRLVRVHTYTYMCT